MGIRNEIMHYCRRMALTLLAFLLLLAADIPYANAANAADSRTFIQVGAGSFYSVGLRSDGSVWTWGRNIQGEMGIEKKPTIVSFPYPLRLRGLTDITSIAVNGLEGYQLGIKSDGTVWEWGKDPLTYRQSVLPRQVKGISGVRAVTSSGGICTALLEDGTVVSWVSKASEDDTDVKLISAAGIKKVVAIESSGAVTYAITSDGFVYAWRSKLDENRNVVLGKPAILSGLSNIRQVSAEWDTGHAVNSSGRVWSWKFDLYAKGSETIPPYVKTPAQKYTGIKVKQIRNNLLLTETGVVYSDIGGKLIKVSGLPSTTAISSGAYHSLALDKQGRIWGWGANKWFETGSAISAADGMVYRPALVKSSIDIFINGKLFESIVPAYESGSTVQIPIKFIAPAAGIRFAVLNDGGYELSRGEQQITFHFQKDKLQAELNGEPLVLQSSTASAAGSVTVPYEILNSLGMKTNWNSKTHILSLTD